MLTDANALLGKSSVRKYKNETHILSFAPLTESDQRFILRETASFEFVKLHDQQVVEIGGWKHMTAHLYIYK